KTGGKNGDFKRELSEYNVEDQK
ncbi:cyclic pyranopterin monophosphate synthase MoaC, partial [Bacillus vallismortis]|nr:cyclic pyranopterin monophosphate synthase MoaC [Bacillus vallismortis]